MNAIDRSLAVGAAVNTRPSKIVDEHEGRLGRMLSWSAACAITLLIHVGVYWFLTRDREPDRPPLVEQPAAVMIDMSPEVQQAFSQTDEAVGQPMQESVAALPPPVDPTPDLTPPVEESPTPPVAPLPPKPPEKPKVEKKQPPSPKAPPVKASNKAATRTASAPRSDSHAERTTAASAGAANAQEIADWDSQVYAAINREKRRPADSDASGAPMVRMQVSASGAVYGISVVVSSGSSDLDEAAREAVERASPFPAPPAGARSVTFRMVFH